LIEDRDFDVVAGGDALEIAKRHTAVEQLFRQLFEA
jgi:hypothetical protein